MQHKVFTLLLVLLMVTCTFPSWAKLGDVAIFSEATSWISKDDADIQRAIVFDNLKNDVPAVGDVVYATDAEIGPWAEERIDDGKADILITFGWFPTTLYTPGNVQVDDSIAERFLYGGNIILNCADYIFYVTEIPEGGRVNEWYGLKNIININVDMWSDGTDITPTDDGKKYTPSLVDFRSHRTFKATQIVDPWSVEVKFGDNGAGFFDPGIIKLNDSSGRVGICMQNTNGDLPRGQVLIEMIDFISQQPDILQDNIYTIGAPDDNDNEVPNEDVNHDGLVVESVQANHIKSSKEIQLYGPGPGSVIHQRYTGQDFEIHATVKNQGDQESTVAVLKYYCSVDDTISADTKDDELLDASVIKPLPVGDSARVFVRVTAPKTPGVYYYSACLGDSVGEGNCRVVKITVRDTEPDLVIESIRAEPSNVLPGSQFKLHVSYRNQGALTSAETAVKYYRSANETFSDTDKLTATGERVPVTGKSTISRERTETAPENPGTYYYGACVESVPNESKIDNNCSKAVTVTVSGIGLSIPEGLISDVAFTPNHTFFVLHPQFLPATNNSLDDYLLHRSTITLHLGGLHLDDTADYYTLPLTLKDNKSITEQVEDIGESTGKMLVQYMIGKIPLSENFKFGDLLKIGKIFFSFGNISDPNDDPKVELVYYANKHFGNTIGGDTYPILYIIKNKRITNVGFEVEQVYHPPGSWIDIDLDFGSETSPSETFSWLPTLLRIPAVFIGSIAVGAADLVFGTIEEVIEGFNSLLVDINNVRFEPTTVRYEGVWNLEETFQTEHSGLAAPSVNLMSLADYPLFQQLPPEVQVDLFQFLEAPDFRNSISTEILRIPEESSLLPNYPNPFNPETWIPYQLAKPANVNISIYGADGKLVRKLNLGHQPIGIYQGKNRAAHWNGKNDQGEPVASGIYFYTLSAGEYTATRRMLILK